MKIVEYSEMIDSYWRKLKQNEPEIIQQFMIAFGFIKNAERDGATYLIKINFSMDYDSEKEQFSVSPRKGGRTAYIPVPQEYKLKIMLK